MEKSIKEYAEMYHYTPNHVSISCRTGVWHKLPEIKSVRKVGNNWMITLKEKVETSEVKTQIPA